MPLSIRTSGGMAYVVKCLKIAPPLLMYILMLVDSALTSLCYRRLCVKLDNSPQAEECAVKPRRQSPALPLSLLAAVIVGCSSDGPGSRRPRTLNSDPGIRQRLRDKCDHDDADSTITHTVSFDGCTDYDYPALAQYGIDMADPVGVDTPQGDSRWQMFNSNAANAPTMPGIARHPTSTQVVIELSPGADEVLFHYSRLQGERAKWNGQTVQVDSMMVYALYQPTSGSIGTVEDQRKLYSNVPSTTPPWSVWDSVVLRRYTKQIDLVFFDGDLAIDNVSITRKPLKCLSALRGREGRCYVSPGPTWTVAEWKFEPTDSLLPEVVEVASDTMWKGIAATPGVVTVKLLSATGVIEFRADWHVTARSSRWQQNWSYTQSVHETVDPTEYLYESSAAVIGRNCPEEYPTYAVCAGQGWGRVMPSLRVSTDSGFRVKKVADGPNEGYWFVDTTLYRMRRTGNAQATFRRNFAGTHPVPPANITSKCKKALGLKGNVQVAFANVHIFNTDCSPNGPDMGAMVAGILGHEGFGANGGDGHEGLARIEGGYPHNDPHAAIEAIVSADSAALRQQALNLVLDIDDRITSFSADNSPSGGPQGNYQYSGPVYYWSVNQNQWVSKMEVFSQ